MVKITVGVGGAVCGDQKVCTVKVRRVHRGQPDLISQATLFGGIKGEELEKLLVCMDSTRKKYRRQEMILSEEEIPDRIGIVLEGSVQVVQDDVFGNRNIVEKLEKGGLSLPSADASQSGDDPGRKERGVQ